MGHLSKIDTVCARVAKESFQLNFRDKSVALVEKNFEHATLTMRSVMSSIL